jgi:hypothetical protein
VHLLANRELLDQRHVPGLIARSLDDVACGISECALYKVVREGAGVEQRAGDARMRIWIAGYVGARTVEADRGAAIRIGDGNDLGEVASWLTFGILRLITFTFFRRPSSSISAQKCNALLNLGMPIGRRPARFAETRLRWMKTSTLFALSASSAFVFVLAAHWPPATGQCFSRFCAFCCWQWWGFESTGGLAER